MLWLAQWICSRIWGCLVNCGVLVLNLDWRDSVMLCGYMSGWRFRISYYECAIFFSILWSISYVKSYHTVRNLLQLVIRIYCL